MDRVRWLRIVGMAALLWCASDSQAQVDLAPANHYQKQEAMVPMRDGVRLFSAIYVPRDSSQAYPIMLNRTPYGAGPYGADAYRSSFGPSPEYSREGFIFVYQDVRGRWMSEGEFVNMRPERPGRASSTNVDESTDTYDTIDWLLKNVRGNNARVGMWGISYPGFYAAAGMIGAHPALKAVSPQAPIADWFVGDDFHHNGAFYLLDAFSFFAGFGRPRPAPTAVRDESFDFKSTDAYRFFLDLGPLPNANARYLHGSIAFWNDLMEHGTYDEYWRARDLLPHLTHIQTAVLVVGGLFDAEDLYGPLSIYQTIERQSPGTRFSIVLGPWSHGGWARTPGESLGEIHFGSKTSSFFQDSVELPFFKEYLKGSARADIPNALVYETGSNAWRRYGRWPPSPANETSLYFREGRGLSTEPSKAKSGSDMYVSDPASPVPYTAAIHISRGTDYMTENQRFAFLRPDVLSYQTPALSRTMTAAGPVRAELYVSTTGTDADFIVKVIDVLPDTAAALSRGTLKDTSTKYQMLVRAEVMRGKFRNSLSHPEPFVPGKITYLNFELRDINHAFLRGHRIMVQVQSSWFPLVDRNPQRFEDIYKARKGDFIRANIRIYRNDHAPSHIVLRTLNQTNVSGAG